MQKELQLNDTREEWEVNGFKTKDEWLKACALDREWERIFGHRKDYSKIESNNEVTIISKGG